MRPEFFDFQFARDLSAFRGSASNFIPTAKRSGMSLRISPATSPRRPCVFTTRASVIKSLLVSGSRMVQVP